MVAMAPGGQGHTGEGAGEGREDGGRPQGDRIPREVHRAGPGHLGEEETGPGHGPGAQVRHPAQSSRASNVQHSAWSQDKTGRRKTRPGCPVCQNRYQKILICSEISGVLEQTTRDSENSREWGGLQEKVQRRTRMIYGTK